MQHTTLSLSITVWKTFTPLTTYGIIRQILKISEIIVYFKKKLHEFA